MSYNTWYVKNRVKGGSCMHTYIYMKPRRGLLWLTMHIICIHVGGDGAPQRTQTPQFPRECI